jgi:hypothetical protein
MLKSQLKGVPESEQAKIFALIEKNPDFFQKIAVKVQEKVKSGQSQMDATMAVIKENEAELKGMLG